jgi:hypothetical protein
MTDTQILILMAAFALGIALGTSLGIIYVSRRAHANPQWRVQAFLLAECTGTTEKPFRPLYFTSHRSARKCYRELQDSFGPGMARIEFEPVRPEESTA